MFSRDLFRYDETEHKGYYCGELVPSITQLLEQLYPLAKDIPTKNLKAAAERGTNIHELIEKFNKNGYLDTKMLFDPNVLNYYAFLQTVGLAQHKEEEIVYLVDKNKELIAYGHFDFVLRNLCENMFGETGELVLGDLKTTAEINKPKVRLQTELYRIAYQQTYHENLSTTTFVLHLRDGKIKWIPFKVSSEEKTLLLAEQLKEMWQNDDQH